MLYISEGNLRFWQNTKRLYNVTVQGLHYCYEGWELQECHALLHHLIEVAGLVHIDREEDEHVLWETDIIRMMGSFRGHQNFTLESVKTHYEEILEQPCIPIGSIDNDHATIVLDYECKYYMVYDKSVWLLGDNFNNFLNRMSGRTESLRIK